MKKFIIRYQRFMLKFLNICNINKMEIIEYRNIYRDNRILEIY